MRIKSSGFVAIAMAAVMAAPLLMTGCEVHGRVYDSYDHQYRRWAPESPYYTQWENETHRRHEQFEKRSHDEQQDYWKWRDQHNGNRGRDHGHNQDRR